MHTEEIGKVSTQFFVLKGIIQNKCIGMVNGHGVVDESRHPSAAKFLKTLEIYKNTRFENIENVFNITQRLIKEHSEEILILRDLEHSSPSWTRSILVND